MTFSRCAISRPIFHAGGRREGGRRRVVRCPRRAGARPCRRVRLGQVGDGLFGFSARRPSRPHRRGFDRLRGTGTHEARCRGAQGHPRPSHLDGVPGRDRDAEPGAVDRNPDAPRGTGARAPSERAARALCLDTLARVGIPDPASRFRAFPHQLSGGMRQRVAIAIALLHWPALIIADEPTTALDVSVQAQIIHEMRGPRPHSGTSLIWITHDLATVSSLADDILVMYAGQVVEAGPTRTILKAPRHPYTRGLLDSVPSRTRAGSSFPDRGSTPSLPTSRRAVRSRRVAAASPACKVTPRVEFAEGREIRCHHPQGPMTTAMLDLEDVSKRFDPETDPRRPDRGPARGRRGDAQRPGGAFRQPLDREGETSDSSGIGLRKSTLGRIAAGILRRPRGPRVFRADPSWTGRSEAHHEDPDRVPGPVRVPEPPHQDRRDPGRRSDRARPRVVRESQGLCRGVARARRPRSGLRLALPAPVFRRSRQRIAIARALAMQPDVLATSPWPRSTCRSRRRSSTCC